MSLDPSAYPHIIDLVFHYAVPEALTVLRTVSRAFKRQADAILWSHAVLDLFSDSVTLSGRGGWGGRGRGPLFTTLSSLCARECGHASDGSEGSAQSDSEDEGGSSDTESLGDSLMEGMGLDDTNAQCRESDPHLNHFLRLLRRTQIRHDVAGVQVLDLCVGWLDKRTTELIRAAFPNVRALRTHDMYLCDSSDQWVPLIRYPLDTYVTFVRPRGRVGDVLISPIPKGAKKVVVNVHLHPNDPNAAIAPGGFACPKTLQHYVIIFTPVPLALVPQKRTESPKERPLRMFYGMASQILDSVPRTILRGAKYTFVGLLDIHPTCFGLPADLGKDQLKTKILSSLMHRAFNEYMGHEWAKTLPQHIKFASLDEYRATVTPQQFIIETVA